MPSDSDLNLNFDEDGDDNAPLVDLDASAIDGGTSAVALEASAIDGESGVSAIGAEPDASAIGAGGSVVAIALDGAPRSATEESEDETEPAKKRSQWNVFMIMLAISLLAVCISCVTLFLYLTNRYGGYPWWETKEASPDQSQTYRLEGDGLSLHRELAQVDLTATYQLS